MTTTTTTTTTEKKTFFPYMICESHTDGTIIRIRCQSLMEAEQRARIHHQETNHSAIWRFEEESEKY